MNNYIPRLRNGPTQDRHMQNLKRKRRAREAMAHASRVTNRRRK